MPDVSTAKFAFGLARRPLTTGRRLGSLAAEFARIGVGTSVLAPPKRDRRFSDPAWTENWLLRRIVQAYLAAGMTAEELVVDTALDWRNDKRVRFLVDNLEEALSPSNSSITAAHLAATGRKGQLAAFGLFVTVLDTAQAGTVGALADRQLASAAKAMSRRRGYLDGRDLAEVFAWLRPGDLVWNYWVNNYLLGKKPPAFDILFWNADTTRMTAQLHADFVDLALDNKLVTPGALTVLGTGIDLSQVDVDAYLVAGIADHITPWQNCYRSTQLLGGTAGSSCPPVVTLPRW